MVLKRKCVTSFLRIVFELHIFYAFIAGVTSDPDALKRQKTGQMINMKTALEILQFRTRKPIYYVESKRGCGYLKAGS